MNEKDIVLKNLDYNKDGRIYQTYSNVVTVMEMDPRIANKICFNELSYSPCIKGSVPWSSEPDRDWTNTDDDNLVFFLEEEYGLSNRERIMCSLNIVMIRNKFNPVVDCLESLPKWDGKNRIGTLLPIYLGTESNQYTADVMRIFMLGAIARAYEPGCKFDYMMVLIGEQGVGKSYFIRSLAMNDKWLDDNFSTIEPDKAPEKLRGKWIIELAELLAVKNKREFEGVKAFITSQVDNYRPPYARRTENRPRRCVMAGTTNDYQFLSDPSGNRRFLPVEVRKDKIQKSMWENEEDFKITLKQAWAEALYIYKTEKPKLFLSTDMEMEAKAYRKQFAEEDSEAAAIQTWLDNNQTITRVNATQIWQQALNNSNIPSLRDTKRIHTIMRNLIIGWIEIGKQRDSTGNKIQKTYERLQDQKGFYEVQN